jgi:hypothetical protein
VIQWALYYPAVTDPDELGLKRARAGDVRRGAEGLSRGRPVEALAAYPENRQPRRRRAFPAASLLLRAGRASETEVAVKSMSARSPTAQRPCAKCWAAVKHTALPTLPPPTTAGEWMARSYYEQSRAQLTEALAAARAAAKQSPNFGAAWVRVAELEFGSATRPEALSALSTAGSNCPRATRQGLTLKGFILAARGTTGGSAAPCLTRPSRWTVPSGRLAGTRP